MSSHLARRWATRRRRRSRSPVEKTKRMTTRETGTGEGEAVRGAALTVTVGAVMMRSLVRNGLKKEVAAVRPWS